MLRARDKKDLFFKSILSFFSIFVLFALLYSVADVLSQNKTLNNGVFTAIAIFTYYGSFVATALLGILIHKINKPVVNMLDSKLLLFFMLIVVNIIALSLFGVIGNLGWKAFSVFEQVITNRFTIAMFYCFLCRNILLQMSVFLFIIYFKSPKMIYSDIKH